MIDRERISELEQEIGADDLGVVMGMFLSEAEKMVQDIGRGLDDGEHARATHFLRSGALNIGLTGFAEAADDAATVAVDMRSATEEKLAAVLAASLVKLRETVPSLESFVQESETLQS